MEAYSNINRQESQNSVLTYRFAKDGFRNLYVLEDFYCTNPFCDCNHVTLFLADSEHEENRIPFLLNFNRTRSPLPNQKKLSEVQEGIIQEFMDELQDELLLLFKQRYMEAKAYGEKNPMSYLVFTPGEYVNYMELVPRQSTLLDFSYRDQKYFAEDSYELDPRKDNRDVRLTFFKFDPRDDKLPPLFHYTYHFNEEKRLETDKNLSPEHADMILEFNRFIPNLYCVLKKRYKEAKKIGEKLMELSPLPELKGHKVSRNELCPCGSGKKFKKCCGLKVH